jgi:hypothetical protein
MAIILLPDITTADRSALTMDARELVYDTDTETVWFGDGATLGGIEIPTSAMALPTGGTSGQVLQKDSSTDYDVSWATSSSGGADILQVQIFS